MGACYMQTNAVLTEEVLTYSQLIITLAAIWIICHFNQKWRRAWRRKGAAFSLYWSRKPHDTEMCSLICNIHSLTKYSLTAYYVPGTEGVLETTQRSQPWHFLHENFLSWYRLFFFTLLPWSWEARNGKALGSGEHVTMPQCLPTIFNIINRKQAGWFLTKQKF